MSTRQRWFVLGQILKDDRDLDVYVCAVPGPPYDSTLPETIGVTHRETELSAEAVGTLVFEKKEVFTGELIGEKGILEDRQIKAGAPLELVLKTKQGPGLNLRDVPVLERQQIGRFIQMK